MTEEAAFLEAILREPADETVRLVYADWLEERDDVRAEFLRVEHYLRQTTVQEPDYPAALARWLQLHERVPADWVGSLGRRVHGLPLPLELVDLLAAGRWGTASETDRFPSLWGEVYAYAHGAMRGETSQVCSHLRWLGKPSPEHPPGDIEPRLTVLIGDQGIGSDAPFALDYRVSFGQPRVLLYRWRLASDDPTGSRWVEVSPHFPAFWQQLKGGSANR
jgi:uncharacterized protein (TIGR02996 family)